MQKKAGIEARGEIKRGEIDRNEKKNLLNVISGYVGGIIGRHDGLHLHQVLLLHA